jgi:fatty-acyl-CoA synthase
VLNALNYRLDAATIAFCLEHGEAKVLITDREFSPVVAKALAQLEREIFVVDIDDPLAARASAGLDRLRDLDRAGRPGFALPGPGDEWDSLALLYTSGTTGDPEGRVYHHRGAYLNALGNALAFGLTPALGVPVDAADVPLQRLDLHLGGDAWAARTCACARSTRAHLPAIDEHRVTHLCGAPIVLNMLVHAPDAVKRPLRPPRGGRHRRRAPPSA